ncbi:hypothetical protein HN371_06870 [Candidatus Poribacteria bacterium]|nr:hypothetical protein [Candidatus Poribacteria bacterium]MBT5533300.1 hypothetical protein [Candidatus Poribacteria bacterium]MBT5710519.1 hypothetical protein [Candidatus Poribacteria bacterium]MBT7101646.1 hypothetical protein [Candidatus Poribacteria bacterium]MBT7805251.1 hypothetical protein [Candidatus Poribacteria bacterium]
MSPADVIGRYLDAIAPDASRHFLFLFDPNDLLAGIDKVDMWGDTRAVTRYGAPLSLRSRLESVRDAERHGERLPVSVVAIPPDAAGIELIPDMTARAQCVEITPHTLLQHLQPGHGWPPESGVLSGQDFWLLASRLLAARPSWGDDLSGSTAPLLIAECVLGRALRADIGPEDAVEAWERVHGDPVTHDLLRRYPSALQAARRALLAAMPVVSKLNHDPEFGVFLWTMYLVRKYAPKAGLLLPELFDSDVWEKYVAHGDEGLIGTCEEMIAADPQSAVSQMRVAERAITGDEKRAELFLGLLGLRGERRFEAARRIAATEELSGYVTEEALRILLPRAIADPDAISKTRMRRIRAVLARHHYANSYPQYYPRLTRSGELFTKTLDLATHVRAFKARGWERTLVVQPIETWMTEVYAECLTPMGLLWDALDSQLAGGASRFGRASEALMDEARRILDTADRQFARLVERNYIRWISRQEPPPMITVDFLDQVFLPEWRELEAASRNPLAVVLLFHGLRWDEWVTMEPLLHERLPRHRAAQAQPMLALLPTGPPYNTAAIILGRFPALGDSGAVGAMLSERLAPEGVPVAGAVSTPNLSMPDGARGVLLANVSVLETGVTKTRPTGAARDEIVAHARARLGAFLDSIPSRATVFAVSNGGTTRVRGPASTVKPRPVTTHTRWVGLADVGKRDGLPSDVAYLSAEAIRLPNPAVARCAFGYPGVWFASDEREVSTQYVQGGISMAEMIVPCAVYRSRRRPRLAPSGV